MRLTNQSTVPVYTISGSSTSRHLPEWLARKRKRSLKQDSEYANRIELLQDFEFEEASNCVRVSEDGDWVMSTGTYKPQIHVHHLPQLSLSFARHTNAINEKFIVLSSDYSKSLHLQTDRFLEFHTPQGCHYSTRIPRYGRDLIYDRHSTEALIPSVGAGPNGVGEVFRLNLEVGRYMKSYEVDIGDDDLKSTGRIALQGGVSAGSINAATVAEDSHNLLAFGTSLGSVEFYDPRSRRRVGVLSPPHTAETLEGRFEITSLEFHPSGLTLASGSSAGIVHLYDLRSPVPLLKKDQGYGYPIKTITFLTFASATSRNAHLLSEPKILTADKRIIKIWDAGDGSPWTSVEPAVDINSVAWCKDSGMLLTANEGRQQHSFFIPQLGPAPRWCSFLDNLVEEMAEDSNDPNAYQTQNSVGVYDNYKFLTFPQLEALHLDHLVGTTNLLRPYMHGYFVSQQLYEEARLISNPELWQEQRQKSIREKIEKERDSRVRGSKKVNVKINKRLAERIIEREEKNERRKAKRAIAKGTEAPSAERDSSEAHKAGEPAANPGMDGQPTGVKGLLSDSRFAKLFQDEDFNVDENSCEFQSLNPNTQLADLSERRGLTAVEEEELADGPGLSSSDDESDSDREQDPKPWKEQTEHSTKLSTSSYRKAGHRRKDELPQRPRMFVKSGQEQKQHYTRDRSFGSQAANIRSKTDTRGVRSARTNVVGEKRVTFTPDQKNPKDAAPQHRERSEKFSRKIRRSASGNTLRNL